LQKFSLERDGEDWTGLPVVLDTKSTVPTVDGPLPLIGIPRSKSSDARDLDSDNSWKCSDFDSFYQNDYPNKNLITDGNQDCRLRLPAQIGPVKTQVTDGPPVTQCHPYRTACF
jgi:hypothetical protein